MNYSAGKNPNPEFRSGIIAIVGRPNVGKSTLINRLLNQKVSITSRKANTTRHRILGVLSEDNCQYAFIDTPGLATKSKHMLDRSIHKVAVSCLAGSDLVLFLVESKGWQPQDTIVWNRIRAEKVPYIFVVSKIDYIQHKENLLPLVEQIASRTGVTEIVPVSATKNLNIDRLKETIVRSLPKGPALFPSDYVTDRDQLFQTSEIIREQVFRFYGQELPYSCAVQIEKYQWRKGVLHVHGLIWTTTDSQKKILIGSGGSKLKQMGTVARSSLENYLDAKVYLKLWVKVRTQWVDDPQHIANFGFTEQK